MKDSLVDDSIDLQDKKEEFDAIKKRNMEVIKEPEGYKQQPEPKQVPKKKVGVATQKMFIFKPKYFLFGMPSKEEIDHEINAWLKWQVMNGQPAVLGKYLYSNNKFIAIYLYTEFIEI